MTQRISLLDALVGLSRTFEHMDGRRVVIDREDTVTGHGDVHRMPGEGMPRHEVPSETGDLVVAFEVDYPRRFSASQKKRLRELLPEQARAMDADAQQLREVRKKREEVVAEVLRAKARHWDNVITATEDTLRQLSMVATVSGAVRQHVHAQTREVQFWSTLALGVPGLGGLGLFYQRWSVTPRWALPAFAAVYGLVCYGAARFLREHCRQFERLQVADLDSYFEEAYAWFFIHADAEDLRGRWSVVRPRVTNILRAAPSIVSLPQICGWEISRIDECLEKDIWYLRLLAKLLRGAEVAA